MKLSDGEVVPADIVVVGIGSTPIVDFLDGSGVELASREVGGGVACNEVGRTNADGVYALGDMANWRDHGGAQRRAEHWNHTVEQAAIVAAALLGTDNAVVPAVPYFWSDQYDLKIQVLGGPRPTTTCTSSTTTATSGSPTSAATGCSPRSRAPGRSAQ